MTSLALDEIITEIDSDDTLEALSQVAEAAERYEDMIAVIKALVRRKINAKEMLSSDVRNLLSVAYKNVVGSKRSSWRMLNENLNLDIKDELFGSYKKQVETELEITCKDVLELVEDLSLLNKSRLESLVDDEEKQQNHECQVFYLKMIGDYYRYLTEVFKDNEEYKGACNKNYSDAMDLAKEHIAPTNPTRLGLALNYSVCHYEILDKKDEACTLAKAAFDEAIEKLDSLADNSYKDATLIMQLLRDNLTIWNQADEDTADQDR